MLIFSITIGKIYSNAFHKVSANLNKLACLFFFYFSTYYIINSFSYTYELLHICTNNIYIPINIIYSYWYFD